MARFHGRTRREAVRMLLARRQEIVSCFSRTPAIPGLVGTRLEVRIGGQSELAFGSPARRYFARIQEQFDFAQATPGFDLTTVQYRYEVYSPDLVELVSYHQHPFGRSHVHAPHLHLPTGIMGDPGIAGAHLPTGNVELEDFVRFLITELGARPLRADWEAILSG